MVCYAESRTARGKGVSRERQRNASIAGRVSMWRSRVLALSRTRPALNHLPLSDFPFSRHTVMRCGAMLDAGHDQWLSQFLTTPNTAFPSSSCSGPRPGLAQGRVQLATPRLSRCRCRLRNCSRASCASRFPCNPPYWLSLLTVPTVCGTYRMDQTMASTTLEPY